MRNIPNLEILGPPSILPQSLQQLPALSWYEKRESYDFTGPSRQLMGPMAHLNLRALSAIILEKSAPLFEGLQYAA